MRADRLVSATLYLQRHGRVTATQLAEHLEVSVATARRDLEALSAAGVPVYPRPGRGGGWQLVGGARTDLTGLTEPEVGALFAAITTDGDRAARSALAKLVLALPAPFRDLAESASSSLVVDPVRWDHRRREQPHRAVLREAVVRRRRVRIEYRGRTSRSVRTIAVEPWRMVDKAGVTYLLAGTERGPRTYRLERVDAVTPTQDRFARPAAEQVEELWQDTVATVESARTAVRARVRAEPRVLAMLEAQLGAAAVELVGRREAVVAAHTARGLAEQLVGWGSAVLVIDSPAVIEHLRTIAAELLATYPEPSPDHPVGEGSPAR